MGKVDAVAVVTGVTAARADLLSGLFLSVTVRHWWCPAVETIFSYRGILLLLEYSLVVSWLHDFMAALFLRS